VDEVPAAVAVEVVDSVEQIARALVKDVLNGAGGGVGALTEPVPALVHPGRADTVHEDDRTDASGLRRRGLPRRLWSGSVNVSII